jgi:hypothetical protein
MGGILGNEAWRRSNGGVWLPRVFEMPEVMYGWCSCGEEVQLYDCQCWDLTSENWPMYSLDISGVVDGDCDTCESGDGSLNGTYDEPWYPSYSTGYYPDYILKTGISYNCTFFFPVPNWTPAGGQTPCGWSNQEICHCIRAVKVFATHTPGSGYRVEASVYWFQGAFDYSNNSWCSGYSCASSSWYWQWTEIARFATEYQQTKIKPRTDFYVGNENRVVFCMEWFLESFTTCDLSEMAIDVYTSHA